MLIKINFLSLNEEFTSKLKRRKRNVCKELKKILDFCFFIFYKRKSFDRGIAQLVEHRSPKPRVVSSNLTAPAKENQGFARNCKPFYSDFFMQNTRTQNQTVSKPSQNGNYRTRLE